MAKNWLRLSRGEEKAATKETAPGEVDQISITPGGDPFIKARSTDGAWWCTGVPTVDGLTAAGSLRAIR